MPRLDPSGRVDSVFAVSWLVR